MQVHLQLLQFYEFKSVWIYCNVNSGYIQCTIVKFTYISVSFRSSFRQIDHLQPSAHRPSACLSPSMVTFPWKQPFLEVDWNRVVVIWSGAHCSWHPAAPSIKSALSSPTSFSGPLLEKRVERKKAVPWIESKHGTAFWSKNYKRTAIKAYN